jgi:hypothetical protein
MKHTFDIEFQVIGLGFVMMSKITYLNSIKVTAILHIGIFKIYVEGIEIGIGKTVIIRISKSVCCIKPCEWCPVKWPVGILSVHVCLPFFIHLLPYSLHGV